MCKSRAGAAVCEFKVCNALPLVQEGLTSTTLDVTVFWVGLFAPGLLWGLLGVGSLLRFNFEWLLLILTALSLSMGERATCDRPHAIAACG